nr:hypothetical protein [Candidatus Sigynarchaeota archaeon]
MDNKIIKEINKFIGFKKTGIILFIIGLIQIELFTILLFLWPIIAGTITFGIIFNRVGIAKLREMGIKDLYEKYKDIVKETINSSVGQNLDISKLKHDLKVSKKTALNILFELAAVGDIKGVLKDYRYFSPVSMDMDKDATSIEGNFAEWTEKEKTKESKLDERINIDASFKEWEQKEKKKISKI